MSFSERMRSSRSVFFDRVWLYLGIFFILLGMAIQEPALSLLGLAPLLTAGASWLWARYSLDKIEYSRQLSADRVFSGDTVHLDVTLVNRKLLPVASLDIEDELSDRLRVKGQNVAPSGVPGVAVLRITTAMRWYEKVTWRLAVECPARGSFKIGPVRFRASDAFGFFQRRESSAVENYILVYPRIANLDEIGIPARHLLGDLAIRRPIITDPTRTVGVRDYRPEDSFRDIHWNATARTQQLQTKVYEPTTTQQYGIFLNLDTFERYWEGLDFDRAEGAIIVAATIAKTAVERGHAVGMYANGVVANSDQPLRVRPGRSLEQIDHILTGLAKLSPIASLNFPRILQAETVRFPMGSTLVVITGIMTEGIKSILDELVRDGHRIVLITIGDVDVPLLRHVTVERVDLEALSEYIPKQHHYAIRMDEQPLPDLEVARTGAER